ncbi:hypothetical protein DPMN_182204 [Dreissena polymorpha]|uniref:Uncharacterized protein n=1 Tax=Dreissena polymorpha TaxID=45954 RepID=A0A9D4I4G1_DREPO|nr:hypothetical protein DPMN_182204 [Dreissena polymorpha]
MLGEQIRYYIKTPGPNRCRINTGHIRQHPACEPCSSLSIAAGPRTSGNVIGAPGGQHSSFWDVQTRLVTIRDDGSILNDPGWSV